MFNSHHTVSSYTHSFMTKHGPFRLIYFTWWLPLVVLSRVDISSSFGDYIFAVRFFCGYADVPLGYLEGKAKSVFGHSYTKTLGMPYIHSYLNLGNAHILSLFNSRHTVSSYTQSFMTKNGPFRLIYLTWWLPLVILSRVDIPSSFGDDIFAVRFFCG